MITEPFRTISEKLLERKKILDSKLSPRNVSFFLGDNTEKRQSTILASFQGIKTPTEDELKILASQLGEKSQAKLSEGGKNIMVRKANGTVVKLDAHYFS